MTDRIRFRARGTTYDEILEDARRTLAEFVEADPPPWNIAVDAHPMMEDKTGQVLYWTADIEATRNQP